MHASCTQSGSRHGVSITCSLRHCTFCCTFFHSLTAFMRSFIPWRPSCRRGGRQGMGIGGGHTSSSHRTNLLHAALMLLHHTSPLISRLFEPLPRLDGRHRWRAGIIWKRRPGVGDCSVTALSKCSEKEQCEQGSKAKLERSQIKAWRVVIDLRSTTCASPLSDPPSIRQVAPKAYISV